MNARQLGVLGGTSLLRGGSYVLIVYALAAFGPLALALGQSIVAALVLLALRPGAAAWRTNRRVLPWIAFLQNVAPIALVAAAVAHLDTGVVAILLATTPLLSAAIARATGAADRLTRRQLAGLVVGLAGVAATTGAGAIDSVAQWRAGRSRPRAAGDVPVAAGRARLRRGRPGRAPASARRAGTATHPGRGGHSVSQLTPRSRKATLAAGTE